MKGARGRPTEYNQEIVGKICERIAAGESLRRICSDAKMPGCSAVFVWLAKYPKFAEQYARAREAQADTIFDEILDIADDGSNDWMRRNGKEDEPGWRENGEAMQRSRLRVDARKWMAGKLAPKKYGEHVNLTGSLDVNLSHEERLERLK